MPGLYDDPDRLDEELDRYDELLERERDELDEDDRLRLTLDRPDEYPASA